MQSFLDNVTDDWIFLINGDFNFPNINWDTYEINPGLSNESKTSSNSLLVFCEKNGFTQIINKATRNSNTLDLLMSNLPDTILDISTEETILSDHNIVIASLATDFSPQQNTSRKTKQFGFGSFNFRKADFTRISDYISNVRWHELIKENEPCVFLEQFKKVLINICHLCVPLKSQQPISKNLQEGRRKYGSTKGISCLKRKEKKLRRKLRSVTNSNPISPKVLSIQSKLLSLKNEIKALINNSRYEQEKQAISCIKANPKYFYSYVKQASKTISKIGPLITINGDYVSDPGKMADLLQSQFCSVFSDPNLPMQDPQFPTPHADLNDIEFTVKDVSNAIDTMKVSSAPGEDEIPAVLLKTCRDAISQPLYLFWRASFDHGYIHPSFLSQIISPIFKGGSKLLPVNYRPVSLTSHLIKIFERVLLKRLVDFVEENSLLSHNQHGFRRGHSCLSKLLAHFDEIFHNLEQSHDSDVIYLDFSKAFDKVDHNLLIKKLQLYGICGKTLQWLKAFLLNRTQKVIINGHQSFSNPVISGVPQGTVLGPLLFILFINDLDLSCSNGSNLRFFADNSRLIRSINPIDSNNDSANLQSDLNLVIKWALNNNMKLNNNKFVFLSYCVSNISFPLNLRLLQELPFAHNVFPRSYITGPGIIEASQGTSDLGIYVSNNYSFKSHIIQTVKKANNKVNWVLSVFRSRQVQLMLTLYKSLVLGILEYNCPLWDPSNKGEIAILEGVQRRFTSKIASLQGFNYWERLEKLKLFSLQRRRERYIIIYMWKIYHLLVPNDLRILWHYSDRRGVIADVPTHFSNISKVQTCIDKLFKVKGPKLWNCLPKEVNTLSSLPIFKAALDKVLVSFPDRPPVTGYTTINSNSVLDWRFKS